MTAPMVSSEMLGAVVRAGPDQAFVEIRGDQLRLDRGEEGSASRPRIGTASKPDWALGSR